jgi:hypothetical protein
MAGPLDNAWRGLEEVDGLAATKRHWAVACGPGLFRLIDPFLTPTGERAEWIPDPTDRLRQMRVIPAFRPKYCDFTAVSEEEPRSPDVPLSAKDLAVYRLDLPRLGRKIAAALGFPPTRSVLVVAGSIMRLGWMPTHGLDVVLVMPCRDEGLLQALDQLRAKTCGELALITPTSHTVVPHVRKSIDSGLLQHATLSQLLSVAEDGTLSPVRDVTECFAPSKMLESKSTGSAGDPAYQDLSKQIEQGFNSIRKETVEGVIAANEMRKELEAISGRADAFVTQLIAGFGSDKGMATLFLGLLATGPHGKPITYAKVGAQMGITKQAVEARFKKMGVEFPAAYRHLKTLRSREKTTQFSALSPKERKKQGVDSSYDYDAG